MLFDKKYYQFGKESEATMNNVPNRCLIALYTNGPPIDEKYHYLSTYSGPRMCWDVSKFILHLYPNKWNYLKSDSNGQKFHKLMSNAFVNFIPEDKLIHVTVHLGALDCVKNWSAFWQSEFFRFLERITLYIKTRIAYEDSNQLKRKFQAFLDKKIYILSIEATGENKYDLDMKKYMNMGVCPSYKIEDFFNEIYNQDLSPEMMFSKYDKLATKAMKENLNQYIKQNIFD